MQAKDLEQLLGTDIPNAMLSVRQLEANLAPILVNINKHRDQIDPSLMGKFDSAMIDLSDAKEKMKKHGNFDR